MRRIFTIGYEGRTPKEFTSLLKTSKVTLLLDVRELPLSRKAGFSKASLCALIEAAGLDYLHERRLGAPREIRHSLRANGDLDGYFARFESYLDSERDLVKSLAASLRGNVALMCFERNPTQCHRSVVARHLSEVCGAPITHLGVSNGSADHASLHPRKSLPSAQRAV